MKLSEYKIKVFDLNSQKEGKDFLKGVILPEQAHFNNIVEIKTGKENLKNCDGVFTSSKNYFSLGVQTADCAPIVFYDQEKYGIIHAGWRGLVRGIVEKMLKKFTQPEIFVGPLLKRFEIQKDDCYNQIEDKFGEKYFTLEEKSGEKIIIFEFQKALQSVLPRNAVFDPRDTFENSNLASWRRDHNKDERNFTIIYHLV